MRHLLTRCSMDSWPIRRRDALGATLLQALLPSANAALPARDSSVTPSLRLVANYWEPYTGNHLPFGGLATRPVRRALLGAGFQSDVTVMPWPRALMTVTQGSVDGIVAIWSTGQRRNALIFSEPYLHNELFLFHRIGMRGVPRNLTELSGFSVAVGRGYDYSDEFLRDERVRKEPGAAILPNLLKLVRGRVDLVLEDPRIVEYQLSLHAREYPELSHVQAAPNPLMRLPLHFAVSKQRPDAAEIIDRFNATLYAMQRDGPLGELTVLPSQR